MARSALGVLLATGTGMPLPNCPVGHPDGSPRLRTALNLCPLSSAALWLVSRCLFVLGFSPLYTPIPLWEKSTFAFQSLANRRGLYYILMAAPGLQGSDDKSSDVVGGDPLKHKFGSSVCLKQGQGMVTEQMLWLQNKTWIALRLQEGGKKWI